MGPVSGEEGRGPQLHERTTTGALYLFPPPQLLHVTPATLSVFVSYASVCQFVCVCVRMRVCVCLSLRAVSACTQTFPFCGDEVIKAD